MGNNSRLGLGLEGLFQNKPTTIEKTTEVDINLICANPHQPRKEFKSEALAELAESIQTYGVIQPITVVKKDNYYMVVAGERRLRESRLCGLSKIPVIVKEFTEQAIKEIALIENLQREDLNAIEEAVAMKNLIDDYSISQEELAEKLGKSRPVITNALILLKLDPSVQKLVIEGAISPAHAKYLCGVKDTQLQIKLAADSATNQTSVRELSKAISLINFPLIKKPEPAYSQSHELKEFTNNLQCIFATKVKVSGSDSKGKIQIEYFTADDLQRIYDILQKTTKSIL